MSEAVDLNQLMRELPAVETVLMTPAGQALQQSYRRDVIKRLVQQELASARGRIAKGKASAAPGADDVASAVGARLDALAASRLKQVVNATGVILHTNLGRAVLSDAAQQAVADVAQTYCDLEYDLARGERSHRDDILEPLLLALTGCEAATVVNNCAAAVMLTLNTLAAGREIITSRGELVEIGGSFRVPDVVRSSGATLVEVGTTNRTRVGDYEAAITDNTAVLLKTHTSNFRMEGFIEETGNEELVELGKRHKLPVFNDLGSGYIEPEEEERLDEPGVLGTLASGVDVMSFSGDKLLGGPQAGIILGKKEIIKRIRKNPLWRVLRIDKFTAGALAATLGEHLQNPAGLRAGIARELDARSGKWLETTAKDLLERLKAARPEWTFELKEGEGSIGGGSLPGQSVPSLLVSVQPAGLEPDELHEMLRRGDPPVVGYPRRGAYILNALSLREGDVGLIAARFKGLGK